MCVDLLSLLSPRNGWWQQFLSTTLSTPLAERSLWQAPDQAVANFLHKNWSQSGSVGWHPWAAELDVERMPPSSLLSWGSWMYQCAKKRPGDEARSNPAPDCLCFCQPWKYGVACQIKLECCERTTKHYYTCNLHPYFLVSIGTNFVLLANCQYTHRPCPPCWLSGGCTQLPSGWVLSSQQVWRCVCVRVRWGWGEAPGPLGTVVGDTPHTV